MVLILAVLYPVIAISMKLHHRPEPGSIIDSILAAQTGDSYVSSGRFPGPSWEHVSTPDEEGWSSKALEGTKELFDSTESDTLLVIHGGRILVDWGADKRFYVASIRKSLLSALYGIHVAERSLDLTQTLGELGIDDLSHLTEEEKQAGVADLLKSRSGVYHPAASSQRKQPSRGSHPPGTFFSYNNWDFNVLGTIFEQETGRSIHAEFKSRIADAIGMEDFRPEDGGYAYLPEVSVHRAYHFELTARDLARFGLLYLRKGQWRGEQIVPEEWIEASMKPYSVEEGSGGFGYCWWVAVEGELIRGVELEDGAFAAKGFGVQRLVVIPSRELVIVYRYIASNPWWFPLVKPFMFDPPEVQPVG